MGQRLSTAGRRPAHRRSSPNLSYSSAESRAGDSSGGSSSSRYLSATDVRVPPAPALRLRISSTLGTVEVAVVSSSHHESRSVRFPPRIGGLTSIDGGP